jgi:hypothetical protein
MMSINFGIFCCLKKQLFFLFQPTSTSFLPCFQMTLGSKIFLKKKIIKKNIYIYIKNPSAYNIFMYFLVFLNIISNAFNQTSMYWCPLLLEKEKLHIQLSIFLCFQIAFSITLILFVVILLFIFVSIRIFLLFLIFHYPWCCLRMFLLLTKLRSLSNQNIQLI